MFRKIERFSKRDFNPFGGSKYLTLYPEPFELRLNQEERTWNMLTYIPIYRSEPAGLEDKPLFYIATKMSGEYGAPKPRCVRTEWRGAPFDLYPPKLLHENAGLDPADSNKKLTCVHDPQGNFVNVRGHCQEFGTESTS